MQFLPIFGSPEVSIPQRLARTVVAGLGVQSVCNGVVAFPQRHGGGYQTEAGSMFRESVQSSLLRCIDREGASPLPPERVIAHCLGNTALAVCTKGADPGCATVAARSLLDEEQRPPVEQTPAIRLDAVGASMRHHFVFSEAFEQAMDELSATLQARMGEVGNADDLPYTRENLQALLEGEDDFFLTQLLARGVELNTAAREIAAKVFALEPEKLDRERLGWVTQWLDKHYPRSTDVTLSKPQLHQLLVDLAAFMNAARS